MAERRGRLREVAQKLGIDERTLAEAIREAVEGVAVQIPPYFDRFITAKFDRVDERFDEMRAYVDSRFDRVDERFDELKNYVDARLNGFEARLEGFEARLNGCLLYTSPSPRDRG